jgi:hypothetical protein
MVRRIIIRALVLICASGVLLGLSLLWHPIGLASLPLTWPFPIIFGADETTERYGVYGGLVRVWLCSVPVAFSYAVLWAGVWRRSDVKKPTSQRSE